MLVDFKDLKISQDNPFDPSTHTSQFPNGRKDDSMFLLLPPVPSLR
jgi:hypothetical protein